MLMRKIFGSLLLICVLSLTVFADAGILEKLKQISQISDIQKMEVDFYTEYYQFWYEQPIDHMDPSKGTFKQKVLLGHKKDDAPVIVELQGYNIWTTEAGELSRLFKGNQLTIEHRFFDQSVPEGGIPWDYLTISQAADDQHEIIQAIKTNLYPDSKWVTTGISKGGQATIFHRYFYPDDVDISVPYVAPLNLEYVDPRLEKFLTKLGANRNNVESIFGGGSDRNDCRWSIRDFQLLCFKYQEQLVPLLEKMAEQNGYTFEIAGGVKRVLQLIILEYPFAFWQWGANCADIPASDCTDMELIFGNLAKVSNPTFFEDKGIRELQPFFYAALTEIGMYDYDVKPFKKYLDDKDNITFAFTMPEGVVGKEFNEKQMKAINKWLQTDAERMLFIYGGSDPWSATAVDLKMNGKCRKYIQGDMNHGCRIANFDPISKEDLINTLKEWLKEDKNVN